MSVRDMVRVFKRANHWAASVSRRVRSNVFVMACRFNRATSMRSVPAPSTYAIPPSFAKSPTCRRFENRSDFQSGSGQTRIEEVMARTAKFALAGHIRPARLPRPRTNLHLPTPWQANRGLVGAQHLRRRSTRYASTERADVGFRWRGCTVPSAATSPGSNPPRCCDHTVWSDGHKAKRSTGDTVVPQQSGRSSPLQTPKTIPNPNQR